jgi:hypothetical protein
MFLQGNLQLVWDIWAPILDPLATDDQWFGADSEGRPWADCVKESTLTSLNWIITHHFYLPAGADTASETMRQDIHQGDLDAKAMQNLGQPRILARDREAEDVDPNRADDNVLWCAPRLAPLRYNKARGTVQA